MAKTGASPWFPVQRRARGRGLWHPPPHPARLRSGHPRALVGYTRDPFPPDPIMFEAVPLVAANKAELYEGLAGQMDGLLHGERDRIANAANFSALVFHTLPGLNWCGFYFFDGTELVVGPFQGKPACVRIAIGRGVCGTAAATRETQVVQDVHEFPGHIACDAASRSEIVVPLFDAAGGLIGVWDVDSPLPGRFDDEDRIGMERLCAIFLASL